MFKTNQENTQYQIISLDEGTHRYVVPHKIWNQYWKNCNANGTADVNPRNIPTYSELIASVKLSINGFLLKEITRLMCLLNISIQGDLDKALKIQILANEVNLEFPSWISAKQLRAIAGSCRELFGLDYTVSKETQSSSENKLFWVLKADIVQILDVLSFSEKAESFAKSLARKHALNTIEHAHTNAPGISLIIAEEYSRYDTSKIPTLFSEELRIACHEGNLEKQSISMPDNKYSHQQVVTQKLNETNQQSKNINLFFKHVSTTETHLLTIDEKMPLRAVKDRFEESIQLPKGSLRYTLYGMILTDKGTIAEWNQQHGAQIEDNSTIKYTLALRGD